MDLMRDVFPTPLVYSSQFISGWQEETTQVLSLTGITGDEHL